MRRAVLLLMGCALLGGCSCKEWGYCAHIFPNAERFAQDGSESCPLS